MTDLQKQLMLKNASHVDQFVYGDDGSQICLPACACLAFPEDIANKFLETRAGVVHIYAPEPIPVLPGEATEWLANISGSPFQPKTVRVNDYVAGSRTPQMVEIPNLMATPQTYIDQYDPGQAPSPKDPSYQLNLAKITIRIEPYTRAQLPATIAKWCMQMCRSRLPESKNHLIRARPPTAYEPNITWPYERMYAYGALMDKKVADQHLEPDVVAASKEGDRLRQKMELFQSIFWRLVDPVWSLPTQQAVEALLKGRNGKK